MNKILITLICLVAITVMAAYGQGAKGELVSQRMVDAINSGKFYFRFNGVFTTDDDNGRPMKIVSTSDLAIKDGVSMSRMDEYNMVSLSAGGCNYALDEQQKTYIASKDDVSDFGWDIGKLTFRSQGTCKLNGVDYYYDEWGSAKVHTFTFYYNTARIAAIDLGMPELGGTVMSLLSFDPRIPKDMYFCLGKEWKENTMGMSVDMSEYLTPDVMKDIIGALPEGMDLSTIMAQAGVGVQPQPGMPAAGKIPPPPICSTSWTDNTASTELAAGLNLGDIRITNKKTSSPTRYLADFSNVEIPKLNLSMDVTDDGIWKAFDKIGEETKGMTDVQAMEHLLQYCDEMIAAAEFGCVTGEMIERAVATCMLCPSSAVYNNTAMLFFYKGDTPNALLYYQQAEKMDGDNAIILTNIAECFFELSDYTAARRYADRAVSLEPDYGLAYQLLTSLNLQEKLYVLAAETLFKSARTYFSDITACQFISLKMALYGAEMTATSGFDMKALVDRIFSPAHLDLLTEATRAGFTTNGQDIPANQKQFDWPVQNGSIQSTHKSLRARREGLDSFLLSLRDRIGELQDADNYLLLLYLSMGTQNITGDIENIQEQANAISPIKINFPSLPSSLNSYAMASTAFRQGNDGSFLLDARQYYCLDMWMNYYRLLYNYSAGLWANGDLDAGMTGCPAAYVQMLREKRAIDKAHEEDHIKFIKSLGPCGERYAECSRQAQTERQERECYIAHLRCILPHNKDYVRNKVAVHRIELMNADKKFYTSTIQPVLEEWWLRMNAMTGYCDNLNMQEYYLTETMRDINEHWQHSPLSEGWINGESIDNMWNDMVVALEKEIGIQQSIIDQMPADVPPMANKSDIRLKNFGEKDKFDFNVGVNTPFGRISFARDNNHYKVGTENTVSGTTTIHNLTNGEKSTYSTYASLAHTPEPSKGYLQTFGEWALMKGTEKMVDAVGRGMGMGMNTDASDFVPFTDTQTGIQRMRTIDSEGNVTDSGIVKFRERSFGVGDVGASVRQTQIRTGNSIRTTNHVRLNFHFLDVQMGK